MVAETVDRAEHRVARRGRGAYEVRIVLKPGIRQDFITLVGFLRVWEGLPPLIVCDGHPSVRHMDHPGLCGIFLGRLRIALGERDNPGGTYRNLDITGHFPVPLALEEADHPVWHELFVLLPVRNRDL